MRAETLSKLMSLKGLLDSGAITREDFEREKALLLSEVVRSALPSVPASRPSSGRRAVLWAGIVLLGIAMCHYRIFTPLAFWVIASAVRRADRKSPQRKVGC